MDTQLSRFYLAAHPLHRLMAQFRANGSHQGCPADVTTLRSATRLIPLYQSAGIDTPVAI